MSNSTVLHNLRGHRLYPWPLLFDRDFGVSNTRGYKFLCKDQSLFSRYDWATDRIVGSLLKKLKKDQHLL